ncbi:ornithine cyclodeaminase [Microbacterium betulae]|uniref:Ornithine cyclodeaminase n=1 Tax=Microbacterium betulae TaxID=2981139 RepID=A0AA97FF93_9MICO|nr:ornithine cyclodeaminase [Microbacterium sp. AB]WOF22556.1 ornithine cyclodeaminase [Microbacterium sp. AB]
MTTFVGVRHTAEIVAREGVARMISGMIGYLEHDFSRWQEFEKLPRIPSHTPFGVIELMPASDAETYAFKYVNGHPWNPASGYQTVTAFGVLADVHNGYPVFVSEMTLLTALRTAATSSLVARYLARADASVAAFIGTGSQSEFQAIGLSTVRSLRQLRIWDVDAAAMDKFERNMSPLGIEIVRATSAADAVRGADIVTTCTADKAMATVLHAAQIEPGVHINAIGGDCPGKTELEPAILDSGPVFVEFTPQTRIEGEIQQMPEDFPVVEFWQVVQGIHPGRSRAEEVTIYDSVGFAIEDFSALRYLRDVARAQGLSADIDLVAEPEDPKDLYGLVGEFSPVG